MLADCELLRDSGAAGVVFGCLTPDGEVDEVRTSLLVTAARPLLVTNHRAFDMARDAADALEALVRCGVDRVLSSGQKPTCVEGLPLLLALQEQAWGRIAGASYSARVLLLLTTFFQTPVS